MQRLDYLREMIAALHTMKPVEADLPQTGDASNMLGWLVLLGMSGAALIVLRKRAYNK